MRAAALAQRARPRQRVQHAAEVLLRDVQRGRDLGNRGRRVTILARDVQHGPQPVLRRARDHAPREAAPRDSFGRRPHQRCPLTTAGAAR